MTRRVPFTGVARGGPSRDRDEHGYDAFLSYSHAGDGKLAPALQRGIETFAKPWYRIRALKVFRDQTSLSANPQLWPSIERALSQCTWFVLMASPAAADSPWVAREIEWWLEHRAIERLLIVLTSGELHWDDETGDFDQRISTALPVVLRGAFGQEPRWVDARWDDDAALASRANPHLQDVIADVASAISGVRKDELVGIHVSEHRRTMRLAVGATVSLAILLVMAIIATMVAIDQRNTAVEQMNIATARQLAAVSARELATNLDVAQLLAVRAYRTNPNPQTHAGLLQAVTFSPSLVRYLHAGSRVTHLVGSGDGRTVVAGLGDGRVVLWRPVTSAPKHLFTLPEGVAGLAVNHEGTVVLASGGSVAMLSRTGRQPIEIRIHPDQHAGAVAVSPSGRTAVVGTNAKTFGGRRFVVIVDAAAGVTKVTHEVHGMRVLSSLVAPSDRELLLLDGGYGFWQRRRIPEWAQLTGSRASFGVRNYAFGTSSDGGSFSYTNGDSSIPVWRTDRHSDSDAAGFTAQAPISHPQSLALSPDGAKLAVADSGAIYVSAVAPTDAPREPAIQLLGSGSINPDGVRFFGSASQLISATGSTIALWDLEQPDRIARTARVPVRRSCTACPGPSLRMAPGGRRLAIVDGNGESATILALDDMSSPAVRTPAHVLRHRYGPAVWDAASRYVALPLSPPVGGSGVAAPGGLPPSVRAWPAGEGSDVVVAAGLASNGRAIVLVGAHGQIRMHDADTGVLQHTIPGPPELADPSNTLHTNDGAAAVDSVSDVVAVVVQGSVRIVDVIGGNVAGLVPGSDVGSVAFSGRRLLVQRGNGMLEVWSARGSTKEREIAGDESYVSAPVGNYQGTVVARQRSNGSIVLADLDSGGTIGTFPPGRGAPVRKTGIAFSPDGRQLITVTEGSEPADAQLVLRDISAESWVRIACATAGRAMTAAEWQTFVGTPAPDDLDCR